MPDALLNPQNALRRRYERFPYPGYPLGAGIRWQEGYRASPGFAAEVAGTVPWRLRAEGRALVLGCGDTFAAGFNRWLKGGDHADYVDFAASSLTRSQLRTAFAAASHRYHHAAIEEFVLSGAACSYHHIEAFGVLHHCPDPASILSNCARLLVPGGTMRLMVYNSPARARVHAVQDLAARKGWLSAEEPPLAELRRWLVALAAEVPGFEEYAALSHSRETELVDALLNPLEQRLEPSQWLAMITAAGLEVAGQLDRYGQLGHLVNPLAEPPAGDELDRMAAEGILTQNLEWFLVKPGTWPRPARSMVCPAPWQWGLRRLLPPAQLSDGELTPRQQRRLWRQLIDFLWWGLRPDVSAYQELPAALLGQLARQGWLLKAMMTDEWQPLAASSFQPLCSEPNTPKPRSYCAKSFASFRAAVLGP